MTKAKGEVEVITKKTFPKIKQEFEDSALRVWRTCRKLVPKMQLEFRVHFQEIYASTPGLIFSFTPLWRGRTFTDAILTHEFLHWAIYPVDLYEGLHDIFMARKMLAEEIKYTPKLLETDLYGKLEDWKDFPYSIKEFGFIQNILGDYLINIYIHDYHPELFGELWKFLFHDGSFYEEQKKLQRDSTFMLYLSVYPELLSELDLVSLVDPQSLKDRDKVVEIITEVRNGRMSKVFALKELLKIFHNYLVQDSQSQGQGQGQQEPKCPQCLVQNTYIQGKDIKYIEDYQKEDLILSLGKLDKILEKYERLYDGKIVEIKGRGLLQFGITLDHPIKVVKKKKTRIGWSKKRCPIFRYESENPRFIVAKDLDKDDYLVFPKLKEIQQSSLSKELARFYGLYLAEGYSTTSLRYRKGKRVGQKGEINLCFGKHEKNLIEESRKLIKKIYGKTARLSSRPTATLVQFDSVELANFLKSSFGLNAREKQIPSFLMYAGKEIVKEFIRGYLDGDGYIGKKGYLYFTTSSRKLALQLQKLLSKLDIWSAISKTRSAHEGMIEGRNCQIHDCYIVQICSDKVKIFGSDYQYSSRKPTHILEDELYFYIPIRSITTKNYQGKVFNFKTSSETYEVSNILVHNCGHDEFEVVGYEDPKSGKWIDV